MPPLRSRRVGARRSVFPGVRDRAARPEPRLPGPARRQGLSALGDAVTVTYVTLRTAYSPDALLGRIGSTARVVSLGLQPVGMLGAGLLIDATSGTATLAIIGIGLAVLALAFLPVRVLRSATVTPHIAATQPADGSSATT